jgi:multidrug efflux pump subunit AcrB
MNTGRMFIVLKPFDERSTTADQIIARLRPKLAEVPGVDTYLQSIQNIRVGARLTSTQYHTNLNELNQWAPKMLARLRSLKGLRDVASDQQTGSLQLAIDINRDTAAGLASTSRRSSRHCTMHLDNPL